MITRHWLDHAEGSVLVEFGKTRVLCAASFTPGVPRWRKGSGEGWVTAEYAMLPRSTNTRSDRESVKGRLGGQEDANQIRGVASDKMNLGSNPDNFVAVGSWTALGNVLLNLDETITKG